MSSQAYIFELSEKSFAASALQNSYQIPVLVEFMGVWSGPCISMADRLSQLATEFAGQFIFAKVDIDEQQALREQYKIENVPTLLVFRNGSEVQREVGELSEDDLRRMLKDYGIYSAAEEMRKQAREKHMAGDTEGAILALTEAIKSEPGNVRVAMDMVQIFLDIGQLEQAQGLFNRLPEAVREHPSGRSLMAQIKFASLAAQTDGEAALRERLNDNPTDHEARFDLSLCRVAAHDIKEAMDLLFEIQSADANYREGAAKEMIGLLANMLSDSDPDAANDYRRRLANLAAG